MTTYYNIVYNGNLSLEEGKTQVEDAYAEDYWNILPIERMEVKEKEPQNSQQSENSPFQRAEEKATKAIQKHSMYMGGREYNPQIDEAFLLLGKARYYDQRFIPAKDAFSFILNHYPTSSTINEAKIWIEKVNLRLEYYDMAISNLVDIINSETLTPLETYEASSTLAQAYILEQQHENAIPALTTAIQTAEDDEKKGRLLFIKGQLFGLLGQKDSALFSFDQVIELNRKSPRRYMIHSKLEKLRLKDIEDAGWFTTQLAYQELVENRENRPFLDYIYYDNAIFNLAKDSIDAAIDKFNTSLKQDSQDTYLKSQSYYNLAEIYFDRASYETSAKYYDSTMTNLSQKTLEYRQIKRKRDNLDDVIKYEALAKETDSILNLVNASEEERLDIFESYIEELKEEQESVFAKKSASSLNINSSFGQPQSQIGAGPSASTFYFYDNSRKQNGQESFKKLWGDIQLADNWRRNPSRTTLSDDDEEEIVVEEKDVIKPEFDPQTYISQIPTDEQVIDSIASERNFAYYQLGIIYNEKFQKYDLAISKLESLLENDPDERLILPSKYALFKIYNELGNASKASYWKNDILQNHPESRYASILRNPEAYRQSTSNPQNIYTRLYRDYKSGQYNQVLDELETQINRLVGSPLLPKFELLRARVLAKLEGAEAYKETLNYVALTYPQSKEGKYAEELLNALKNKNFSSQFDFETNPEDDFILVYNFHKDSIEESKYQEFKLNLEQAIAAEEGLNLDMNEEVYSKEQTLITVNGLGSQLGAKGLAEKFIKDAKIDEKFTYFVISQKNYKTVQVNKNLDQYLEKKN